jgi:hypothetical protein
MTRITLDRWSIDQIARGYSDNISLPESQRNWSWKGKRGKKRMELLIDSAMNNYSIPSCILYRKGLNTFDLYDGRHRFETFQKYRNDEFAWKGRKYSELTPDEKNKFDSREIPVTIISDTTLAVLAEMFIRMNQGVPLKDYDRYWANRFEPFIQSVERLIQNNERLSKCLGGQDMKRREDLANWVALLSGLVSENAGNMTTSYIRFCEEIGFDHAVNDEVVRADIDVLCELLETANDKYPALDKDKKDLRKVGKIIAFFFGDWFKSHRNRSTIAKWVSIIGRLRGSDQEQLEMKAALSTSGAQNLTSEKIKTVLLQVDNHLEKNITYTTEGDSDDDSE